MLMPASLPTSDAPRPSRLAALRAQAQVLEPECRMAVGPSALQTVAREIRDEQL